MNARARKQSPKALEVKFSPEQPTRWYVHITGVTHGKSAAVKKAILAAVKKVAVELPGAQTLRVTAQVAVRAPREE